MLENQTIEELIDEFGQLKYEGEYLMDCYFYKEEILKRFKELEEYKSMYEGLEK